MHHKIYFKNQRKSIVIIYNKADEFSSFQDFVIGISHILKIEKLQIIYDQINVTHKN